MILSVGYEGRDVDELAARLATEGVTTLVDVRQRAASRRRGFAKGALAEALGRAGIGYVHERALGNPPENRDSFRRGDGRTGRARMEEILRTEPEAAEALARLAGRAAEEHVAVLCVEREPARCHRRVVTDRVQALDPSIEVVDLDAAPAG